MAIYEMVSKINLQMCRCFEDWQLLLLSSILHCFVLQAANGDEMQENGAEGAYCRTFSNNFIAKSHVYYACT
jgi:hypothetical protein